jgi:hypothetical protein
MSNTVKPENLGRIKFGTEIFWTYWDAFNLGQLEIFLLFKKMICFELVKINFLN